MRVCGLVLAAGGGSRFGGPKGLARTASGEPWVVRAVRMLRAGGCDEVLVAVGARGDEVAALVPADARVVRVPDWDEGLSATLRTGLAAAADGDCGAIAVTPVDTPDAPASAVIRVRDAVTDGDGDRALVQAVYGGRPGHPVLIGRAHVEALAAGLTGDRGARPYLREHGVVEVECADLWPGNDLDRPG